MATLSVVGFGGGVVLEGSADTRKPDEILEGDSLDLGPRGALVCASDVTDYVTFVDGLNQPWTRLYALLSAVPGFDPGQVLAVGEGSGQVTGVDPFGPAYLIAPFARQGQPSPVGAPWVLVTAAWAGGPPEPPSPEGVVVTGFTWPGTFEAIVPGAFWNLAFFCLGAREGFAPNSNPLFGLYAAQSPAGAPGFTEDPIQFFDALGTGQWGELPVGGGAAGTNAQQLFFRGIVPFNDHLFGWGFDSRDTVNADGPARVMFSNLGLPLKWGNDNQAAVGTDRLFTDSDAITLGSAGEIIRAATVWSGKLWFFTNQQGHYIAGYGRDSFLTDGATAAVRSYNVIGPHALIEGPDRQLYGVCDQGLWSTADGLAYASLFEKLRDFAGHSNGWWDLIWTDPTATLASYPGRTNQDLVWMAVDWERQQVLIGIPYCNAAEGAGLGSDTVVIRYHTRTGGFTRQIFPEVSYTAQGYFRRQGQQPETKFMGTAGPLGVRRYGYTATGLSSPVLPSTLPRMTFGPYAPHSPDGRGTVSRGYLTLAWEAAASLPLRFACSTTIDESPLDAFVLFIGPTAPGAVAGDVWLDTSETTMSLGDNLAGTTIPARGGFVLKTLTAAGTWSQIPGLGMKGTRATLPLPLTRRPGTRMTFELVTTAAAGRFEVESFGLRPAGGTPDA